jgi:hypothetical protein
MYAHHTFAFARRRIGVFADGMAVANWVSMNPRSTLLLSAVVILAGALAVSGCLGSAPQMAGAGTNGGGSTNGGSGATDGGIPVGMLLCQADLSITGTYAQGNAPPADFPGGCWPDGTWTFTVAVSQNGCSTAPKLEAMYSFKVQEDNDYNDTITYLSDPTNKDDSLKLSGGEGGLCTGAFLLFSADGKTVINLRPALQVGNVLNGKGDYRIYDQDQRF